MPLSIARRGVADEVEDTEHAEIFFKSFFTDQVFFLFLVEISEVYAGYG